MCILDIFVSIIVTLGIFAIPSSTLTFKRLPIHKKMDPKPDTLHTDTFNESVSSILERKVRGWLSGVIDDMRRNSPVQQWLDSLPPDVETPNIVTTTEQSSAAETAEESKKTDTKSDENKAEDTVTENTVVENNIDLPHDDSDKTEVPIDKESIKTKLLETKSLSSKNKSKLKRDHSIQSEGNPPRFKNPLLRDLSLQSDGSGSSGSSVLNVLGARRVDAESVLLALGFGPSEKQQQLQRIPDRFLSPSKLKGISTEEFIKHEQHSMRMHDCGIFGYRGLTGNPHVPPSTIVAKIMERIIQDDVFREEALIKARHSFADMRSSTAQSKIPPPTRLRST